MSDKAGRESQYLISRPKLDSDPPIGSNRDSGHDRVVVDRLTKSAHFLPVRTDHSLDKLVELYIKEIIWLHGILIRMQSRCIRINKIYILNPTAVAELLQYSGSKVEHKDVFSSYK